MKLVIHQIDVFFLCKMLIHVFSVLRNPSTLSSTTPEQKLVKVSEIKMVTKPIDICGKE